MERAERMFRIFRHFSELQINRVKYYNTQLALESQLDAVPLAQTIDPLLEPEFVRNFRHRITWHKDEINADICLRTEETNVHAIVEIVVQNLASKFLVFVVSKPLTGKLFESGQLWPDFLV